VIVGGSDSGIAAGLRAREVDAQTEVTVVVADAFPNYSICGLPFYLSGETPDWHQLAHRTVGELEAAGLDLLLEHAATSIDPARRQIRIENRSGHARTIAYDRLVIATGAEPVRPSISGLNLPGVYLLHTMEDSFHVYDALATRTVHDAVVVGTGYIGLEMADALTHRGVRVTLIGRAETVLPTVDPKLGQLVKDELRRLGVDVIAGTEVEAIERDGSRLAVRAAGGVRASTDLVIVGAGVRPNSALAASAGVETGINGALRVDRHMRTNIPDIYAAGDCVETWHRVLGRYTYLPLGTTAHKQGRVTGENTVGGQRMFEGSVGTQVVKVFDLAVARTGLSDRDASEGGFDPLTIDTEAWDHKAYYPGAQRVRLRVTGDTKTGQLLGAQIVGPWQAEVAKRIDVYAAALFFGMAVDGVNDLDLSYTPPFGSPWDAVQIAAQAWERACAAPRTTGQKQAHPTC
jgi:NADPH-dependent 2,4-dienoyl-CoA reductase/sulfur reductase-like enzyme